MKRILSILLSAILVLSLSTTAFAGGYEDGYVDPNQELIDQGYPVVYRITDSIRSNYSPVSTDQTGDYVSIYIQGYNISADTVKPVIYDDNGNAITGEVMAVETVKYSDYYAGAYFRIEKLESDCWDIPNEGSENSKDFKIELEAVGDKEIKYNESPEYYKTVTLYRRDVYYSSYDNIRETLTVYFSTDVQADVNTLPEIQIGYTDHADYYYLYVVKEATADKITKEVNPFTGQEETKAVFNLAGFDHENAFGNWWPRFAVTFKNGITGEMETYDTYDDLAGGSQIEGRTSMFQETNEVAFFENNCDVILYYPYWIGGVHQISASSNDSRYYITEADVNLLGNDRYTYATVSQGTGNMQNSSFENREYNYSYFITVLDKKPQSAPVVKVKLEGDSYVLSWNKIDGADGYIFYGVEADGSMFNFEETTETEMTFEKAMLDEMGMMGNIQFRICAYTKVGYNTIEGPLSAPISFDTKPALSETSKNLKAGKTFVLSVDNANGESVSFTSNKKSVATVNKKTGKVTALKKGTAKITAKVGNETLTCTVKVKSNPQVKFKNKEIKNNQTISVKKGKTLAFTISGKADTVKNKVTSSKKSIAKITSNAKKDFITIKGVKKGTSTIKVTVNNAVTYNFKVKVK